MFYITQRHNKYVNNNNIINKFQNKKTQITNVVMIYCASLMQTLNFSIPMSYKSSHAWTNRFQNGKMWRVQRGKKRTDSDSANISLTADMNRRVSVGISSCKHPNRVSNRIEEIPEQQERKTTVKRNILDFTRVWCCLFKHCCEGLQDIVTILYPYTPSKPNL